MSEGSDLLIFRTIAQAHDPRRCRRDIGFRQGEDGIVFRGEIIVELLRDVARQLDMLLLIVANRDMGGLVQQHVCGLQDRVGEQRDRLAFAVLAGLILPLGHAVEPAHPRGAIEQPLQFGMSRNLGLVEQDRLVGIDPAGDQGGDHLERGRIELGRVMRHADGVQICQEDQARAARGFGLFLKLYIIDDRTKVIAKMRLTGGLNAGNDVHGSESF
jgi:hypothetical protein